MKNYLRVQRGNNLEMVQCQAWKSCRKIFWCYLFTPKLLMARLEALKNYRTHFTIFISYFYIGLFFFILSLHKVNQKQVVMSGFLLSK